VSHNRWHPDLEPIAEVAPGEEVRLETTDGLAGQLIRDSSHADAGRLNLGLGHPLEGPLYVEGAEPGDALEVEFVSYEQADFGATAVIPGFGYLPELFPEPYLVKWEIADGLARSEELPGVAVPEATFAGVVGVAPSHERMEEFRRREEALRAQGQRVADPFPEAAVPPEAAGGLRTIPPRETGGNMDIPQLVAGSMLWLPVDVPGALFRSATSTSPRATARCAERRSRSPARSPSGWASTRDSPPASPPSRRRDAPRGARSRQSASRSTRAWT
jgi:formamidase